MSNGLRAARERAGLSQADLADRVGVSRQMVGAVEAGRNVPAVDAALRMATALGTSVEALFGTGSHGPVTVLGGAPAEGARVVVCRVGDLPVVAPVGGLSAGDAAWAVPDALIQGGEVRMLPGAATGGFMVAGCDPVLGLWATMLARGARRLVAVEATSHEAAGALAAGRLHAALVHAPQGRAGVDVPTGVHRIHVARWQVGLGAAGAPAGDILERVLDGSLGLIQRAATAASQRAFERAAAGAGASVPAAGRRASGHIDAARTAAIAGCAAITFEPAARQAGLTFAPLETHDVELWIDDRWADHPTARALCDLIGSAAFGRRVGLIGGYDMEGSGTRRSQQRPRSTPSSGAQPA